MRTLPPRAFLRALILGAPLVVWTVDASAQEDDDRPSARVTRTETAPVIDGRLDDEVWQAAQPIGPLTQVVPIEGAEASERTEVRFLFDRDYLYVAIRCFDSDPSRLVTTQRERDAFLDADDRVELVFDTFLDRRNAFFFQVSAAGSIGDALISNNGADFNKPWDGIWRGETTIDSEGWSAELALPFKTLNFRPGLDTWGFNIERRIGRKNEEVRWSNPSRDVRFFQVVEAGRLQGFEGIDQGIGLDFVPFFVANAPKDYSVDPTEEHLLGDAGFDLFYKVTPSLNLALTYNTDFAETEVDSRVVNLTRFPLFFPEQRDFFLQDAGLFQFGQSRSRDVIPFFSRTIGLSDGEEVPILGGIKLTGRAGKYNIGFLDVQTDDTSDLDGQNLLVTRVTRNVGEQSSVGGIFTNGNPGGDGDNAVFGLDAEFRSTSFNDDKNLRANFWGLVSDTEGLSGDNYAYGAALSYPNDQFSWRTGFKEIQENFNPELGFVPRGNIRKYDGGIEYSPRLDGFVRQLAFGLDAEVITDTDDELETIEVEFQPFGIEWDSGDELRLEISENTEDLNEDFDIIDDIVIPQDRYDFTRGGIEFESAPKRPVSVNVSVSGGGFFDGTREEYGAELMWRPGPLFNTSVEYEFNDVSLEDGDFTTSLSRLRANFAFSPTLTWSNFLQWDDVSDSIGLNSRLRWIPVPGRELFLVFNDTHVKEEGSFVPLSQEAAFKITYTVRF